jgi:transposase-like protein
VKLVAELEPGVATETEVARFERGEEVGLVDLGLRLKEAKRLTAALQARMEPQAECMLVLIGATPEGKKEPVGLQVGMRESAQSWHELLAGLKARGLAIAPGLAIGDGALGFWRALEEVFPTTRHQRCWVHKTINVMDKLPKSVQPAAKQDLREIWQAPDRATAETAITTFAKKYAAKYENLRISGAMPLPPLPTLVRQAAPA